MRATRVSSATRFLTDSLTRSHTLTRHPCSWLPGTPNQQLSPFTFELDPMLTTRKYEHAHVMTQSRTHRCNCTPRAHILLTRTHQEARFLTDPLPCRRMPGARLVTPTRFCFALTHDEKVIISCGLWDNSTSMQSLSFFSAARLLCLCVSPFVRAGIQCLSPAQVSSLTRWATRAPSRRSSGTRMW